MHPMEWLRARPASSITSIVGVATFLFLCVLAVQGAVAIGITGDEGVHLDRLRTWFDIGVYVPKRFTEGDLLAERIPLGRAYAYGPAFSIVAHIFAVLVGAEPFGDPQRTAAAFAARHVMIAILGILAALAVGLATWVMTKSRVIGIWAAAATMALPLWAGYSTFAIKDVPAAAGWTFFSTALVLAMHPAQRRWQPITIGVLAALGVWFAVGVRSALWLPLAGLLALYIVLVLINRERAKLRTGAIALAIGGAAGTIFIALALVRYPPTLKGFFYNTLRNSSDFGWTGRTLTAGELVTQKPPWWYLPAWIGGSVPVLIELLFVVGAVIAVIALFRRTSVSGAGDDVRVIGLRTGAAAAIFWGAQALVLPVGATLLNSTIYAGMRQHLYVLPAIAALAGLGAFVLWTRDRRKIVATVVLAAALVAPTVDQATLFPYQYVYKNVLAGPVTDRWETDMHFTSSREALQRVPAGADVGCLTRLDDKSIAVLRQAECRSGLIVPYRDEQGIHALQPFRPDDIWVTARNYRGIIPTDDCRDAGTVTRTLRGEQIVMGYVVTCDPAALAPVTSESDQAPDPDAADGGEATD